MNDIRLPVGPHTWIIPEDVCGDGEYERTLFLTACSETDFACHEGRCIPIDKRSVYCHKKSHAIDLEKWQVLAPHAKNLIINVLMNNGSISY